MNINWQLREINLKVVYYGPAMSGKTTNLEQIHARTDPKRRSELVSLKTHEDRTLFFDFMQLELGQIGTFTPVIQLYTVPGQTYYEASRKLVLRGADGVVFVVDSAADKLGANIESWRSMIDHLSKLEIKPTRLPIVVQFNKQDLPNALSPATLKNVLRLNGLSAFPAVAVRGEGVLDTLKTVTRGMITQIQKELA